MLRPKNLVWYYNWGGSQDLLVRLNPTGKCREEHGPYPSECVQHQCTLWGFNTLKVWIDKKNLVLRDEESTVVFDCEEYK